MSMEAKEAWEHLKQKFTSGNSIQVERATILRKEYEAILNDYKMLKELAKCLKNS